MTEREALKLALEALEKSMYPQQTQLKAIAAIKEALAQPAVPQGHKQEPSVAAAWQQGYDQGVADERTSEANIGIAGFGAKVTPARQNPYGTTPPPVTESHKRKPLTHEQRFDLLTKFEPHKNKWEAPAILIDMVEAAHGIKEKNK